MPIEPTRDTIKPTCDTIKPVVWPYERVKQPTQNVYVVLLDNGSRTKKFSSGADLNAIRVAIHTDDDIPHSVFIGTSHDKIIKVIKCVDVSSTVNAVKHVLGNSESGDTMRKVYFLHYYICSQESLDNMMAIMN